MPGVASPVSSRTAAPRTAIAAAVHCCAVTFMPTTCSITGQTTVVSEQRKAVVPAPVSLSASDCATYPKPSSAPVPRESLTSPAVSPSKFRIWATAGRSMTPARRNRADMNVDGSSVFWRSLTPAKLVPQRHAAVRIITRAIPTVTHASFSSSSCTAALAPDSVFHASTSEFIRETVSVPMTAFIGRTSDAPDSRRRSFP
mmetsp:Transcript_18815/g.43836  ORF Transcript_18815/g.43836 Transcript_18815/m.43836 type:complete len:200 (-) Transcript_18815:326-925(-)